MIQLKATIPLIEIRSWHTFLKSEQVFISLLKAKGFICFGGPLLPKLCGKITRYDDPGYHHSVMFIQELEECPSPEDLERDDPRNWPQVCPTLTAAEGHNRRIWRSFWGPYQPTPAYLSAQSKKK